MLLWDYEMESEKAALDRMQPVRLLALAVEAIDWTVRTMGPIETEEVRDYLDRGLEAGRQAVLDGKTKVTLPEEMLDAYNDVDEAAEEPGTSHLLSALMACVDVRESVTAKTVSGVLSFCYEGSLSREDVPVWSVEAERQNARCLEVISFQKDLIERMA